MDFIDYCDQHKILLAIFPSHSMHMLQPLDVCMFKPLSQAYSDELSAFLERSQVLEGLGELVQEKHDNQLLQEVCRYRPR
jgi:hypothetical protein